MKSMWAWLALVAPSIQADALTPTPGMVIDRSATIQPGDYRLGSTDDSGTTAVLTIKGSNLTVDFTGSTLLGSEWDLEPDKRRGTALRIEGPNITIKGLKAHGYKIGVIAVNAPNLKVLDSDLSYNWKQKLKSTLEKEDGSDWMSYHKNEADEWLRYGAGIYLRDCDGFEVKGTRIVGGQNGLMLTGCDNGLVWNNSFSFLSSLGLGMYRSSGNRVMHNNIDWCVRGYSHGKYNRGQDSAGILIYEQSNKNVFAYNSVTHGGDGFFLWAGQTTMDTGEGGCNDNLLYGNDFSHAPTNGIEATFSRNKFVNNLLMECWHGIWGGYSFDSLVLGNVFAHNAEGIAWEHGQFNKVQTNLFYRDRLAINLWQNATQDPNWVYPQKKDTRSQGWTIEGNEFQSSLEVARVKDSRVVAIVRNSISQPGRVLRAEGTNPGFKFNENKLWVSDKALLPVGTGNAVRVDKAYVPEANTMEPSGNVKQGLDADTRDYLDRFNLIWAPYPGDPKPSRGDADPFADRYYKETRGLAPRPLTNGRRPFIKSGQLRGRRYILVDEWGPYDFKSPILWPRGEFKGKQRFEILGPKGSWKVLSKSGIKSVSAVTGSTQGFLDVELEPGQAANIDLKLEFLGDPVVTRFGKKIPAGTPVEFGYTKFFAPIDWDVKIYAWDGAPNPQAAMPALKDMALGEPKAQTKTDRLDFASSGAFLPGAPANQFATIAEGTFRIADGEYTLDVTCDDGVRIWVDGVLVIESWKYQAPAGYSATLKLGGTHKIRVEHYEIDGFSALQVALKPKG